MHLSHAEYMKLWKLNPMVVADCVVVKNNEVLLTKRAHNPFNGWWVLPGGLMDLGETIERTAVREVREETGAAAKILALVGVYSGTKRDPRGTTASILFLMKFLKFQGKHDREVSEVRFFPINRLPKNMGFDHRKMIRDALKIRKKKK